LLEILTLYFYMADVSKEWHLGITPGDLNGIGPEVIFSCYKEEEIFNHHVPILYMNKFHFNQLAEIHGFRSDKIHFIEKNEAIEEGKLNVKNVNEENFDLKIGQKSANSGKFAIEALNAAIDDVLSGLVHDIVTAPIDKQSIQNEAFNFKGHTDYLAKKFEASNHLMLMVSDEMKIGMVTTHIPLQEVSRALDKEKIQQKAMLLKQSLEEDFLIQNPKIAVLGLNPHSGDEGLIGNEEQEIILPAIRELESDMLVFGPYGSDGFFGAKNYKNFDGILAMYHDQALIPFKMSSFETGVNYTAGLPIVRTSPDHGVAYDITGKGKADASSFVHSVFLTKTIHMNRLKYFGSKNNPLKKVSLKSEKFNLGLPKI